VRPGRLPLPGGPRLLHRPGLDGGHALRGARLRPTLVPARVVGEREDVVYLNYHELREVMEAFCATRRGHLPLHGLVPDLVRERKEDAKASQALEAPLTIGNVARYHDRSIGIKVFGIIDDVLHPKGEKSVAERIEGFRAPRAW